MPRTIPLTVKQIENAKPDPMRDYKLTDGESMYLFVTKAGGKHWRMKYRFNTKEKVFTIGEYPYISLKDARERRFEIKQMLERGIDPNSHKQNLRRTAIAEAENTFESIARLWFEYRKDGWSTSYAHDVIRRLEIDVFPAIGKKPITSVTTKEVINLLQDVEKRGVGELARRLKQTMGEVFRYGIIHEFCTTNPADNFKSRDVLKKVAVKHFASIESNEIPTLLKKLNQNEACLRPLTRLATKMLMLTFVRPGELIKAEWEQFDLEHKQWLIPAANMKMRKPHLVPLSSQVIQILEEVKLYSRHQVYVFPSQHDPKKHMSDNTIRQALNRIGYKGEMTAHGFRALATTTLQEKLGIKYDYLNRQLSHTEGNKIRAAYDRAQFLEERTKIMQAWGDYIEDVGR
ncbi:MAG: integrase [Pseudomonas fluorescens]|nr:MAG: integrase [Pseudomonas fluorescens]